MNEQVKRNPARFPSDFMFQLTVDEKAEVVAICDYLHKLKFTKALPYAFTEHGMDLGDLERFQRRRKLLKYIGGLREFPKNLRQQFDKASRKKIKQTLTDIYREEAQPYPGMVALLQDLINTPDIRVGIVSRNVTIEP